MEMASPVPAGMMMSTANIMASGQAQDLLEGDDNYLTVPAGQGAGGDDDQYEDDYEQDVSQGGAGQNFPTFEL
jgi:hypothetical protein